AGRFSRTASSEYPARREAQCRPAAVGIGAAAGPVLRHPRGSAAEVMGPHHVHRAARPWRQPRQQGTGRGRHALPAGVRRGCAVFVRRRPRRPGRRRGVRHRDRDGAAGDVRACRARRSLVRLSARRDADPLHHHGHGPRSRSVRRHGAARHDPADLREIEFVERGRVYAVQPRGRSAGDADRQRLQGHPRDAGKIAAAGSPLDFRAATTGETMHRQEPHRWTMRAIAALRAMATAAIALSPIALANESRAEGPALKAYNAAIGESSISGLSSGAYMAVQFGFAWSSVITGVGVVAGGPFYCAQASAADFVNDFASPIFNAIGPCMLGPIDDLKPMIDKAEEKAASGDLDPLDNVHRQKIYLFHGYNDAIVARAVTDAAAEFYQRLLGDTVRGNLFYQNARGAGHSVVVDDRSS